jgi:hypothetical protein
MRIVLRATVAFRLARACDLFHKGGVSPLFATVTRIDFTRTSCPFGPLRIEGACEIFHKLISVTVAIIRLKIVNYFTSWSM